MSEAQLWTSDADLRGFGFCFHLIIKYDKVIQVTSKAIFFF